MRSKYFLNKYLNKTLFFFLIITLNLYFDNIFQFCFMFANYILIIIIFKLIYQIKKSKKYI